MLPHTARESLGMRWIATKVASIQTAGASAWCCDSQGNEDELRRSLLEWINYRRFLPAKVTGNCG